MLVYGYDAPTIAAVDQPTFFLLSHFTLLPSPFGGTAASVACAAPPLRPGAPFGRILAPDILVLREDAIHTPGLSWAATSMIAAIFSFIILTNDNADSHCQPSSQTLTRTAKFAQVSPRVEFQPMAETFARRSSWNTPEVFRRVVSGFDSTTTNARR